MPANERTLLTGSAEETPDEEGYFYESPEFIALYWKRILLIGIFNLIVGLACLLFPVVATQAVVIFLTWLVFATGLLNVMSLCNFGPHSGLQSPMVAVGMIQLMLAGLMYCNPYFTLTVLTFLIALAFMLLGSVQIGMARRYRDRMAAKALMLWTGSLSILMSILICLTMDTAKWWTVGFLLGLNIFNIGCNRIILGLYGRKLAASDGSHESWRSYLDADVASIV